MIGVGQFRTVIIGDVSPDERKSLIATAFAMVRAGGAVRVYGPMPYAERLELAECMTKAGFDGSSIRPLASGYALVIGSKLAD